MPKESTRSKLPIVRPASGPRNEAEALIVEGYRERHGRNPVPIYKHSQHGDIEIDHPDQSTGAILIAASIGSPSPDEFSALMVQLRKRSMDRNLKMNATYINRVLAIIRGIGPRDTEELKLAKQIAFATDMIDDAENCLARATAREDRDSAVNMYTKLSKTLISLLDAFRRHRSTGEQRVSVTHTHTHQTVVVNDGGKAVAITGATGGPPGGETQLLEQSHGREPIVLRALECAALHGSLEAEQAALSSPGGEGAECLPNARRPRRRA